ncbi:lasso peptide biosynthesis PqqD family chaperone [Paenibacillus aceris]|uniref:Lasso peptide biosynthesis PqqD family chaperone n=1 Tax=Paenibacillus aceris TaxID=869555 RepID=A0ABS4I7Z6_9BACL|nr:lasso peptide biosynthesis PqqD family chaperone [Paenibacillus aceris]MBP1967049.1 hypothetical protein [Paenibacillus aceris]NHW33246.1 lasso peptide biosynthesis PqqD family chaperone [Paenibacillus aceris]
MVTNKIISSNQLVVQESGNIVSDMGEEKVMLSIHNGKYYNLGPIGGLIWDMINEPVTIELLVNKLIVEYEVEKSVCENQVLSFLEQLRKEGLISIYPTVNIDEECS